MEYVLSGQQIKALENSANMHGVSFLRLMENAGAACAREIRNILEQEKGKRVSVFCGKGKNGGDGFVIARKLFQNGYDVEVFLTMGESTAEDAKEMYSRVLEMQVPVVYLDANSTAQKQFIESSSILVDAIFGTGFSGQPAAALSTVQAMTEAAEGKWISIDLPSGMLTDASEVPISPIAADVTLTVMAYKPSLVAYPSKAYAGQVRVVRIGIPEELYAPYQEICVLDRADIQMKFKDKGENVSKGDFGKLLLIAGSYEMPGAALLSSSAAVECGAGLVRLAFPDKAYAAVTARTPEKVLLPLLSNREGRISFQNEKRILDAMKNSTVCLIGCGLGQDYDVKAVVASVLQHAEIPLILDADGINAVADCIDMIQEAKAPVILTPHPGEAARLLDCTVEDVQKNRVAAVKAIHEKTGAVVILKGNGTLITADGKTLTLNLTGDSGLATAGTGDVLAGMLAAFLCRGLSPLDAAQAATYLHGLAGQLVSKAYSKCGNTPTKLLDVLAKVLGAFE